jgi:hypothetical protein
MIIMKNKDNIVRSSLSLPAILVGVAMLSGAYFYHSSHTRQYSPVGIKADKDNDAGYKGMAQYFFNARKNPFTDSMDYKAMLATDQLILKQRLSGDKATGALGLNWRSMGPANIGGRTRSIVIDLKRDPSGQTIFAGAVSGGIWKSTNGGATWDSVNDNMSNLSIGCMTEDANGNFYAGTGEGFSLYYQGDGFSTGILGGGVFKSTDGGNTFRLLAATKPSSANNDLVNWAYTNRIAVLPNNPMVVYAATNSGLMVSQDSGNSFSAAKIGTSNLTGNALDVKVSNDGAVVVACVNGIGYYLYPTSSNTVTFTAIPSTGAGRLSTTGGGRIEFAISPTNHDYIYASLAGAGDNLLGVYMTMTAVSSNKGGYWYDIGPGGSKAFDPFSSGGLQDQGLYDNTIGVAVSNPGLLFMGGTTLWSWEQANTADTAGKWTSITTYYGYTGDPIYVHPDMHAIVFDLNHPNTMYIGCDGGIYKSTNLGSVWEPENRNYDVTQFNSICFAPYVNVANGEGIMGGTQDNGTPYMSGTQFFYQDAVEVSGGDGGQCAISSINPNAYYASADFNSMSRSVNLSGYGTPADAYTSTKGLNKGANIDSMSALGTGCFYNPMAIYENPYDTTTLDSMLWVSDKTYNIGDTIYPISANGNTPFPYIINKSVLKGDSLTIQNRVVSKIATGFSGTVWLMMQGIDFQDPTVWMPIGSSLSQPDAFIGGSAAQAVHCLEFSPDGDALFVGTESGDFFRFSNLDSIVDSSFVTGGVYSVPTGTHNAVANPKCRVISTNLSSTLPGLGSSDILSIAVDPKNGNNVIVTTGSYSGGTHVYFSNNALAAKGTVTFKSAQGNLPEMPVYASVMHVLGSPYPNSALVGTEHGVYSTTDITVASPSWTADNNGLANTLVMGLKQQTLNQWVSNNSCDLYIGTHGRGAYVDTTFFQPLGVKQITAVSLKVNMNIYPNPMNSSGTVSFDLPKVDKVTLTIYNMEGKVVKEIPVANSAPGQHLVTINTSDMAPGAYLATLTGTDFRQTTRFIVAR